MVIGHISDQNSGFWPETVVYSVILARISGYLARISGLLARISGYWPESVVYWPESVVIWPESVVSESPRWCGF